MLYPTQRLLHTFRLPSFLTPFSHPLSVLTPQHSKRPHYPLSHASTILLPDWATGWSASICHQRKLWPSQSPHSSGAEATLLTGQFRITFLRSAFLGLAPARPLRCTPQGVTWGTGTGHRSPVNPLDVNYNDLLLFTYTAACIS